MQVWKEKMVHLDHCRGAGWLTKFRIIKDDPELKLLYERPDTYWEKLFSNHPSYLMPFLQDFHNQTLRSVYHQITLSPIQVLSLLDDKYPQKLLHIQQPPWLLYMKGDSQLVNRNQILAVIGTRNATPYGFQVTSRIIPELSQAGIVILSGLAKGIDSYAQRKALEAQGSVISVIGSGLNHIYPKENQQLADEISTKGLMISEYPPNSPPQKHHFPERNRLISGLSKSILVIEGKKRSGTFITVEQGLEQGKDIFAVPGSIFSETSYGPNTLIQQGARIIQSAQDIFFEWGIKG